MSAWDGKSVGNYTPESYLIQLEFNAIRSDFTGDAGYSIPSRSPSNPTKKPEKLWGVLEGGWSRDIWGDFRGVR
jgi:hypothetical protein